MAGKTYTKTDTTCNKQKKNNFAIQANITKHKQQRGYKILFV